MTSCAVCGAADPSAKLEKDGFQILACGNCGLAFWVPGRDHRPERVYSSDYFESAESLCGYDDYASLEPALRASFERRLRKLPLPRRGARLLDVGAAFGFAVSEAGRVGWRAVGLEVSRSAARCGARVAPGAIAVGSGLGLPFESESFDAVLLFDVLEHLPDPRRAVGEIGRVLAPGGRLLLTTGDVGSLAARVMGRRWHLYTLPEHLFFFTRRSLRLLLEGQGFEIEVVRAESSHYTLGYVVERVRKSLLGLEAGAPARWPGAGLRAPLNLFDIVTVRAVKCETGL